MYLLYLYCLFKSKEASTEPSSLLPQKGIDETNNTFVVSCKDLCALVSSVSAEEYNAEALNRKIEDLEWLIPKVNRHDRIIRIVMASHSVIPVRFATIYKTDERLLEVLKSGYKEFSSFLDFISDKEEWGVKVYADKNRETGNRKQETGEKEEGTGDSNELINRIDEKIASASPGEAYLLRKKRSDLVRQQVRQQSVGLLNSLSTQIYEQMLSWAIEGRRNKLLSRGATGKEGEMILNAAFLIKKLEAENFKGQVDALAANYKLNSLSFEISGPWPCYNFSDQLKT